MSEIWFYHLERASLEDVLPGLLEKTLERGWRALVRASSPERLSALDGHLWTYKDIAFLPHGAAGQGDAESQPIYLTCDDENPNKAEVLFLVDGARFAALEHGGAGSFTRIIVIFDGRDEAALGEARSLWQRAKGAGLAVSYWQQAEKGWTRRS